MNTKVLFNQIKKKTIVFVRWTGHKSRPFSR